MAKPSEEWNRLKYPLKSAKALTDDHNPSYSKARREQNAAKRAKQQRGRKQHGR